MLEGRSPPFASRRAGAVVVASRSLPCADPSLALILRATIQSLSWCALIGELSSVEKSRGILEIEIEIETETETETEIEIEIEIEIDRES